MPGAPLAIIGGGGHQASTLKSALQALAPDPMLGRRHDGTKSCVAGMIGGARALREEEASQDEQSFRARHSQPERVREQVLCTSPVRERVVGPLNAWAFTLGANQHRHLRRERYAALLLANHTALPSSGGSQILVVQVSSMGAVEIRSKWTAEDGLQLDRMDSMFAELEPELARASSTLHHIGQATGT